MTDPRNAQPGSYGTSGYGAEAWEQSQTAPDAGKTSVGPNRPGAASPAGRFPPPAGAAAPPGRLREPARSDRAAPHDMSQYDMETRPPSMYRVPWQSVRSDRAHHPLRRPQPPAARPRTPTDPRAMAPDMPWPSLMRPGPRHVPVVGPTEALRGRAGGPG